MTINLGLLGMSKGNGHPYSWSAIFNGYNKEAMENCGFPTIPRYLEKQNWPYDKIDEANVTHIWTQNFELSSKIASASNIPIVVNDFKEMITEVDGILLARDDAENHFRFSEPFLKANLPIYIDKPLAYSVKDAKKIIELENYPGQIFSCSSFRYSKEMQLSNPKIKNIGKIYKINATIPNTWEKYAVHLIEPVLNLIMDKGSLSYSKTKKLNEIQGLYLEYKNGFEVEITTLGPGKSPATFELFGDLGSTVIVIDDIFFAFKASLKDFIDGIINKDIRTTKESMLEVIELLELGIDCE